MTKLPDRVSELTPKQLTWILQQAVFVGVLSANLFLGAAVVLYLAYSTKDPEEFVP